MTPDVKVIVIFKTLTLVLLIGGGGAAGCRHLPQEGDTRVDVARDFLTQAADAIRLVGDEGDRGRLIYDLAPDEAKLGDVNGAKLTASTCANYEQRADTYQFIAEIQEGLGDIAGAKATFELAKSAAESAHPTNKDALAYTCIEDVAIAQARMGDFQAAAATLQLVPDAARREFDQGIMAPFHTEEEARKILANFKDSLNRDLTISAIAERKAQAGDLAGASAVACEVVDLNLRTSTYIDIARAAASKGNTNGARRAYAQARKTAEEFRQWWVTEESSNTMAMAISNNGDTEFGAIVAGQTENCDDIEGAKAIVPLFRRPVARAEALVRIARAQSKAGDPAAARTMLAEVVKVRASAVDSYGFMQELAVALADAGDLPEAMKTVSLMKEEGEPRAHTWEGIIDVLLDRKDIEGARKLVACISDARWQATSLARIAAAEWLAGKTAAARKTFAEARAVTATVPEKPPTPWAYDRAGIYSSVAMKQAETGDFGEIKRWVPLIPDPRDRANCWLGAAYPIVKQFYAENRKRPNGPRP